MSAYDSGNMWDTQVAASLPPLRQATGDSVTDREVQQVPALGPSSTRTWC